jgi:hypothetical protein
MHRYLDGQLIKGKNGEVWSLYASDKAALLPSVVYTVGGSSRGIFLDGELKLTWAEPTQKIN